MKNKFWNIFRIVIVLLIVVLSIFLAMTINRLDVIPTKYYLIFIAFIVLLNLISIIFILGKKVFTRIIGLLLGIVIVFISIIGIGYSNNVSRLLDKAFNNNSLEITGYIVAVLKNSKYDNLDDLNNRNVGFIDIGEISYLDDIDSKITCEYKGFQNVYDIYDSLLNKSIDAFVIDKAYLDLLDDKYDDVDSNIKIIYNFSIEEKINESVEEIDSLESINIFISGSDARSDVIAEKTRSDVNMIMTVNPKTHTILLTSIPRDYYVQLHGTTGLKDKLTHAGIYGVNMSRQTVEDLFDIKIDYTVKVGFKSVVEVVDLIGGIDINSDQTFNSYHIKGWTVKEGLNHFDGKQALAYARERYAYIDGDIHRVKNQQQVLEAIITKIFNNRSILKKYDKLLLSFSDLYRTDIPEKYIKLIVKNQIDDMSEWKLERQYVIGSNGSAQTYSMPGMNLYVMIPNEQSVESARNKILSVYNGE